MPILPAERDPRLITVRRGGTLTDEHHRALAEWSALCAERALPLFEQARPDDTRPRDALAVCRAWIRGEVPMRVAHQTAFVANAAGRGMPDPARFAALAAGQAVAVAHVAAHDLGAAAYAIRAAMAAAAAGDAVAASAPDAVAVAAAAADTVEPTSGAARPPSHAAAEAARLTERDWQRERIPLDLRDLVLDDQCRRSAICWNVFDD